MVIHDFFSDPEIYLTYSANSITENEINALFPNQFVGKDFFTKFYIQNNGGLFTKSVWIYNDHFEKIDMNGYQSMDIESFYYIPNVKENSEDEHLSALTKKWEDTRNTPIKVKEYYQKHFPDTYKAGENYRREQSIFAETHFPLGKGAGFEY